MSNMNKEQAEHCFTPQALQYDGGTSSHAYLIMPAQVPSYKCREFPQFA